MQVNVNHNLQRQESGVRMPEKKAVSNEVNFKESGMQKDINSVNKYLRIVMTERGVEN